MMHAALFLRIVITVKESDSDTVIMVIFLVLGVGGIFILFAIMALCYRLVYFGTLITPRIRIIQPLHNHLIFNLQDFISFA